MSSGNFSTPQSSSDRFTSSVRPSAIKRDSLAAELERDPQSSTAKRQQRTQAFSTNIAHASVERQLVAAQTAKMELESKLREKDVAIERLEGDRRWLAEREKEEREEKEREQTEREEEKRKADHELRALRTALAALREEHADLQDTHSALARTSAQTIASQKAQLSTAARQAALLDGELRELKIATETRSRTIEELQRQLDGLAPIPVDSARQGLEDELIRDELQRQAGYMRKLEGTNAHLTVELTTLRERHTSLEVLREEKRGLERKAHGVNELREKVVRLEAEVQAAHKEREEWARKAARSGAASDTPVSVTRSLTELRLTHARLFEEHGSTVALLRRREAELEEAVSRETEYRSVIEQFKQSAQSAHDKIARLEHAAAFADREIGFLQALNASYVSEAVVEGANSVDEAKTQHIRDLELLIDEYKNHSRDLQTEIDELEKRPPLSEQKPELKEELEKEKQALRDTQKALEESEAAAEQHLEKIETLEQTLFELRGEIGAGRHLPPGVRVLSLKDNPAQQWTDLRQAVMDRLKGENDALLSRLAALEADGARAAVTDTPAADLVPRQSLEVVIEEKKALEDALKQKEKQMLRLRQVFTAKSAEFREAISAIMGVKLAFQQNGTVRVTSQYDLNAAFVFQPTSKDEGARMQLIAQGEGGPQDLPQLMRNWVEEEQNIPCFLASVTLECYDKWKRDQEMRSKND